jgi:hypothetical protein
VIPFVVVLRVSEFVLFFNIFCFILFYFFIFFYTVILRINGGLFLRFYIMVASEASLFF